MGEGGFSWESVRQESQPGLPEAKEAVEVKTSPELIVDSSEADLHESQQSYAIGRGFEDFDKMPPLERAIFWTIESGVGDNYIRAESAAKEAGLDRRQQLEYKIKALESRMGALARSSNEAHITEFYSLDKIGGTLRQELKELK